MTTDDLLVIEALTVPLGIKTLNTLSNAKLLDAEPIGAGRFLILAQGRASDMRVNSTGVEGKFESEVFKSFDQSILDAIYSLSSNKIGESLLILETDSVIKMLSLAQAFVTTHKLTPIDIKIRKTGLSGAYGYFTGSRKNCNEAAAATGKSGSVEVLDEPNEHVKSLFGN